MKYVPGKYAAVDKEELLAIISNMTLDEKLEQTCIESCAEVQLRSVACRWRKLLVNFPNSLFDMDDNRRLGIRGMVTRDGPRGLTCSQAMNGALKPPCPADGTSPAFPSQSLRAATWDPALEEELGSAVGEIGLQLDVHAALLPTINIMTWLNWGRGQEAYGEDPIFSGRMGAAAVRGVQSRGVMATVKHFLANNIENTRAWVSAEFDDKTLHEVYLKAWSLVVRESSPESVMTGYNRVQGQYAFASSKFVTILRERLGFGGIVMTDWWSTFDLFTTGTSSGDIGRSSPYHGQQGVLGKPWNVLLAGTDMEMPFCNRNYEAVVKLQTCQVSDAEACTISTALDRAVYRVLRSKARYGLLGLKAEQRAPARVAGYDDQKYSSLALKIAQEGIVLLKNEAGFLPRPRADVKSVVVLGTPEELEMGDKGSSAVTPPPGTVVSVLDGLRAVYGAGKVHRPNQTLTGGKWDLMSSKALIQAADMVILDVGLNWKFEGEFMAPFGGDRKDLALPPQETDLILQVAALNANVVVAMTSGQALVVEGFVHAARAILWLGYPGPRGGQALAGILAGDVNPSGRMASATPRAAADWVPEGVPLTPAFPTNPEDPSTADPAPRYPYAHGFKHMWGAGIAPRYPFGWGLSYTTFRYGQPSLHVSTVLHELKVRVEVANTGIQDGAETVQVYGTCPTCSMPRLPIVLLGFAKAHVAAGSTKVVEVAVSSRDLAVYDIAADAWVLEAGTYSILVGPCAEASMLQALEHVVPLDARFDYPAPRVPLEAEPVTAPCSGRACTPVPLAWAKSIEATILMRLAVTWGGLLLLLAACWRCCCRPLCSRCCCRRQRSAEPNTKLKAT